MEEVKNIPVRPSEPEQAQRKPYEPPTAEVILLTPQEELASWTFHQDNSAYRWGLNGWANFFGSNSLGDPASGITGTVNPNNWVPPTE